MQVRLCCKTLHAQYEDIVRLAEPLRGSSDLFGAGWAAKHLLNPVETEEFSMRVLCFGDAVRHEQEGVARFQLERGDRKFHPGEYPHRKRAFDLHLDAVEIGGELTGIC